MLRVLVRCGSKNCVAEPQVQRAMVNRANVHRVRAVVVVGCRCRRPPQAEQARRTKRARKGLCLVLQLGSTLQGRVQQAGNVSVVGAFAGRLHCEKVRGVQNLQDV